MIPRWRLAPNVTWDLGPIHSAPPPRARSPADTAAPSEEKEEEMEPDDGRWGRGGDPERLPSTPL